MRFNIKHGECLVSNYAIVNNCDAIEVVGRGRKKQLHWVTKYAQLRREKLKIMEICRISGHVFYI